MVFATAKALAASFCLAANTVGHEYVVVSAAEVWVRCMDATEPRRAAISRIDIGLVERFMTVCRKPPEITLVNLISPLMVRSPVRIGALGPMPGPHEKDRSPC